MPSERIPPADNLALVTPTVVLEEAFASMVADFEAASEAFFSAQQRELARCDFAAYVARLEAFARGENLPTGYVPSEAYWLVRSMTELIGVSSLRFRLTPDLEVIGGHIGYGIRPSQRGHGYGTQLLARTLDKARMHGLKRVLLTCDTDNIASARVIEKNGGVFASHGVTPATGVAISRYWITL
ncbi:MAG TPA: GNAT family N-acetyltransferase [Ktedonobacterales bacterium]